MKKGMPWRRAISDTCTEQRRQTVNKKGVYGIARRKPPRKGAGLPLPTLLPLLLQHAHASLSGMRNASWLAT